MRELLEKLRRERQDRLDRFDLGGVYDEIARELDDIVDEERHAIDNATREAEAQARRTGDERRAETARDAAAERQMRLDFLPDDLAGKVRELQQYDFESSEAQRRFEALMDRLRQQLANQMFEQMSGAMQSMTPEDLARMKDMLAALNEMLERRERGEDPRFEEFMERFGDFFPENPQTLDELLEQLAQRMAAMQAMLNSMTPEQRAQLQELSDQLLGDMDLRWQMDQLGGHLRQLFPQLGWGQSYDFEGQDPLGMGQAMETMRELGDLDQLENLLRNAANPGALAEADMDRVRDLLGDDAARSLERLAELTKMLTEAGLIEQREGRLELTPQGPAGDRLERAARPVRQADQGPGRPAPGRTGWATATSGPTTPSRTSTATRSSSTCSARSATPSAAGRAPASRCDLRSRRLRDRAHRAPHPVEHGADARPVAVDADARQLPAGEEGGDGAALADLVAVPPRLPRPRRASARRPGSSRPSSCPRSAGTSSTARTCSTGSCSPASCSPARAARSRSS